MTTNPKIKPGKVIKMSQPLHKDSLNDWSNAIWNDANPSANANTQTITVGGLTSGATTTYTAMKPTRQTRVDRLSDTLDQVISQKFVRRFFTPWDKQTQTLKYKVAPKPFMREFLFRAVNHACVHKDADLSLRALEALILTDDYLDLTEEEFDELVTIAEEIIDDEDVISKF